MKRMVMFTNSNNSFDENFIKELQKKEIERKNYDRSIVVDRFEFPIELIR